LGVSGKLKLGSVVVGVRGRVCDRVPFNGQLLPARLACRVGGFACPLLAFECLEAEDFGSTGHDLIMHADSKGSLIQRNTRQFHKRARGIVRALDPDQKVTHDLGQFGTRAGTFGPASSPIFLQGRSFMPKQPEMQADRLGCTKSSCDRSHRCAVCDVRSFSICGALDQTDLLELERIGCSVHLAPNEALFKAGQSAGSVYNLTASVARLYKLLPDGRPQILGFGLPGDFVGAGPSDRYGFSADAIEAVSACRVSADMFARFSAHRPQLLLRINDFAARELTLAQDQMLLLGRRTAEEKVAAFLIGWRDRLIRIGGDPQTIRLPMSRQDIADFLGLTIETVSRTLTRFEREKMLVIVSGGVRLLDASRAEALAAA
jgi:CRP/FNR family transcriptional regulator, anaerobic regulatory protein